MTSEGGVDGALCVFLPTYQFVFVNPDLAVFFVQKKTAGFVDVYVHLLFCLFTYLTTSVCGVGVGVCVCSSPMLESDCRGGAVCTLVYCLSQQWRENLWWCPKRLRSNKVKMCLLAPRRELFFILFFYLSTLVNFACLSINQEGKCFTSHLYWYAKNWLFF